MCSTHETGGASMKTIFLHGLGQTAADWQPVTRLLDQCAGMLEH